MYLHDALEQQTQALQGVRAGDLISHSQYPQFLRQFLRVQARWFQHWTRYLVFARTVALLCLFRASEAEYPELLPVNQGR
jgi:hypothetical protein